MYVDSDDIVTLTCGNLKGIILLKGLFYSYLYDFQGIVNFGSYREIGITNIS